MGQMAQLQEYLSSSGEPKRDGVLSGPLQKRKFQQADATCEVDAAGIDKRSRREHEMLTTVARPFQQKRTFRMQQQFLDLIKAGKKRWEGRLHTGAAVGVSMGCSVRFSSTEEDLEMKVRSVRNYRSFAHMLEDLGVHTCLPGVSTVKEGVAIYHSFPGYADKECKLGVVAMELMPTDASITSGS